MRITETRKSIIELIEPYMDKTLSEGCFYITDIDFWDCKDNETTLKDIQENKDKGEIKNICIFDRFFKGNNNLNEYDFWGHRIGGASTKSHYYEMRYIIGHYDITAVLNYIKNNANNDIIGEVYQTKAAYDFENNVVDILGLETKDHTWRLLKQIKLQNKPLHLYTEEEDKQLLELLLKLK